MRGLFIMLIFLGCSGTLFAQNLTGKWVGYFTPNADLAGRTYAYEITIQENRNQELNAFTITKFSNSSVAKAAASVQFSSHSQLVSIQESKFEQLQLNRNMEACLMSNFLTYQNIRGHEILQGNYMSSNVTSGRDCGGGTVFLEKEVAIVKSTKNKTILPKIANETARTLVTKVKIATPQVLVNKQNESKSIPISNPTAITSTNKKEQPATIVIANTKQSENLLPEDAGAENNEVAVAKNQNDFQVIPWVLVGRENKLVKKIITHNKSISIDLYDNGTIDNDTIIVYDNKQLIVNKKRLSYKAIHFDVNFSNTNNEHEIIIVAHNMGTVPPNTALLVFKDADIRQELFITSTNKMNAKLVIEYVPPAKLE